MADPVLEYDFEGNAAWVSYREQLLVQPGPRAEAVILKKKRRWYRDNVDPDYEPPAQSAPPQQPQPQAQAEPQPQAEPEPERAPPSQQQQRHGHSHGPARPASSAPSKVGIAVSYAQLAGHAVVVLLTLATALPFLSPLGSAFSWRSLLRLGALLQLVAVVRSHGRPQWTRQFAERVGLDVESHFAFYACVLMVAPVPSLLAAVPIGSRGALFVARSLEVIVRSFAPASAPKLVPLLQRVTLRAADIYRFNASMEVWAGCFAVVGVFTGGSSFLAAILMWQYLRIRYVLSAPSRLAFSALRAQLERVFHHPSCPGILRSLFDRLVGLAYSMVDVNRQQAPAGGGMLSRCAVM